MLLVKMGKENQVVPHHTFDAENFQVALKPHGIRTELLRSFSPPGDTRARHVGPAHSAGWHMALA